MRRQILLKPELQIDVTIVSKDKDILFLMIWAFSKLNITKRWYLKFDHDKFANIAKVKTYLGQIISLALRQLHALIRRQ